MKGSKVQKNILLIHILVFILGLLGIYFFSVQPLVKEKEKVESSLQSQKQLLTVLQDRLEKQQNQDNRADSLSLQNQLPLEPFYEQLILEIDQAQSKSNSKVQSYSISDPQQFNLPTQKEAMTMMQVTFNMQVVSPTYEDMIEFINQLENSDRIISVNNISFMGYQTEVDLPFQLTFSAYYIEGLDTLQGTKPQMKSPDSSNKQNPLKN
ncbi:type 4a pilus biogenesis protein PilO [Bacillaceae bacterium S4-13-56]